MAEYIEREAMLYDIEEAMKFRGLGFVFGSELKRYIKRQPAADVVEVVHGRWMNDGMGDMLTIWKCSLCGYRQQGAFMRYCPNCGAHMKDGE